MAINKGIGETKKLCESHRRRREQKRVETSKKIFLYKLNGKSTCNRSDPRYSAHIRTRDGAVW